MKVFLAKTDPKTYSIDDFIKEGVTYWDGVHNYQAINVIKTWKTGDLVLIYHSMGQAKLMGVSVAIEDSHENKDDPRFSWAADLKLLKVFSENNQTSLKEIKKTGLFTDFALVKQSRLSTMECTENFIKWLRDNNQEFDEVYQKEVLKKN